LFETVCKGARTAELDIWREFVSISKIVISPNYGQFRFSSAIIPELFIHTPDLLRLLFQQMFCLFGSGGACEALGRLRGSIPFPFKITQADRTKECAVCVFMGWVAPIIRRYY
jgi:hypothetical protein